jgi:hypothetical protein
LGSIWLFWKKRSLLPWCIHFSTLLKLSHGKSEMSEIRVSWQKYCRCPFKSSLTLKIYGCLNFTRTFDKLLHLALRKQWKGRSICITVYPPLTQAAGLTSTMGDTGMWSQGPLGPALSCLDFLLLIWIKIRKNINKKTWGKYTIRSNLTESAIIICEMDL